MSGVWAVLRGVRRVRFWIRAALVGLALGLGLGAAGSAEAVEAPGGEVQPVDCSDSVNVSIADTCAWQQADRSDKFDTLADLLLVASCGACAVAGFKVAS